MKHASLLVVTLGKGVVINPVVFQPKLTTPSSITTVTIYTYNTPIKEITQCSSI